MSTRSKGRFTRRTGSAKCCERELAACGKSHSGRNQDGESWTCPACGKGWIYVEDEAEGGSWHRGHYPSPNAELSDRRDESR